MANTKFQLTCPRIYSDAEEFDPTWKKEKTNFDYYIDWTLFEKRIIPFFDDIHQESADWLCSRLKVMADVNKEPITIELYTHGGEVFPGFAIYDEILATQKNGTPVHVVAKGIVASMGVVIMQAAVKRFATPTTRIMIHEITQFTTQQQKASEVKDQAAELKRLTDLILSVLSKRMKKTKKQIEIMITQTDALWYSPEEAKAIGLIDKVL